MVESLHLMSCLLCLLLVLSLETEMGIASIYGNKDGHEGTPTSNGERVDPGKETCAHRTASFGTLVSIRNTKNGKTAVCRVNDRGPFKPGRIIDVTPKVAGKLGFDGLARVEIAYAR